MKKTLSNISHHILPVCLLATVQLSIANSNNIEFYGTKLPFAQEAIYFAVTDRFVDGDSSNNHEDQGGAYPTWDQKLISEDGREANIGYLGGDLMGVVNNIDYIQEMGFTAIWLTPIMDNPDQNFTGGDPIEFGGNFKDGGKTGYHGYWINNFFVEDEHYISPHLNFEQYADALHKKGMKVVFDIVTNHGSPSFTMPTDQPKFGELYDAEWKLVADHQNLLPEELDENNPLHSFFRHEKDIAELSNLNDKNPEVLKYFIDAYFSWIDKGADAFRIDTIKHVPHRFWKQFTDAIKEKHPEYFMFGESFSFDPNFLAQHTLEKNGGVSVLDFACREAMKSVFESTDGSYESLSDYLYLTHGPYKNPYELITFYDNHDMSRLNGDTNAFIDAHNWLFTTRGIPCVYYGSEMGFMAGTDQHAGNRNYFGQENVKKAVKHPIHQHLSIIANIRKQTPALQRGLQLNVKLAKNTAIFYRILNTIDTHQIALVLLNKSNTEQLIIVEDYLEEGIWEESVSGKKEKIRTGDHLETILAPHSVNVWVLNQKVSNKKTIDELNILMNYK